MISNKNEYTDLPDRLFQNVSSTDLSISYRNSLDKVVSNELWEFGVTVVWKFIILFFYEKMFQIFLFGFLNKNFLDALDGRNRDCYNCFSFNFLEDDHLFQKMDFIWRNIDGNYKNIFRRLLDERNSISHVNEYPYSETKFMAYLEDSLNLLNYLQKLHLQLNFEKTQQYIHDNGNFSYLSQIEIEELLNKSGSDTKILIFLVSLIPLGQINDDWILKIKKEAIDQFVSAGTLVGARIKGLKLLKPLIPYFEEKDFVNILTVLVKNINKQVLLADGIEELFLCMYAESINNYPNQKKEWIDFIRSVKKIEASDHFKELITLTS